MGPEVLAELRWTLTNDGKANILIEGMSPEQIVFVCESIKSDVLSGKIVMKPKA
jgi:hypothetical protein